MNISIPNEVGAVVVGLVGAGVGYAFREYRNRARAFFQITEIDGELVKRTDRADVSQEVSTKLSDTFFLKKIDQNTDLGDLWECRKTITQLVRWWPEDKPSIDKVLGATDDYAMCAALAEALSWASVDNWLVKLLVTDRISVGDLPDGLKDKIPVHDDKDNDGRVFFLFPKKGVSFGSNFAHEAIRAKCRPFIESVRLLSLKTLKDVFVQFKQIVEEEYRTAIECQTEVKDKVNENSRWCFYCYLANLSNAPIIIERGGDVHVRDKTRVHYKQPCYLVSIGKARDGTRSLEDTKSPLVVRPGQDVEFAFMTNSTQSSMELGQALRECFERGQSTCHLTAIARKVGLLKRQKNRSFPTAFLSAEKP